MKKILLLLIFAGLLGGCSLQKVTFPGYVGSYRGQFIRVNSDPEQQIKQAYKLGEERIPTIKLVHVRGLEFKVLNDFLGAAATSLSPGTDPEKGKKGDLIVIDFPLYKPDGTPTLIIDERSIGG